MSNGSRWTHHTKVNGSTPTKPQEASRFQSNDHTNRDEYQFGDYGYGKNGVKLLHVARDGPLHSIRECEVDVHLQLSTRNDYLEGDNRKIIATDSQKNTVYILAKKHGVKSPEEFGLLICGHFLYTYSHVLAVEVKIDEYPWERFRVGDEEHKHAFVFAPSAVRFAVVTQSRNGSPVVRSGLRDLRVLKTTQSAFRDFVQDGYRTLPDTNDRVFSTIVCANWEYSTVNGVDFDEAWRVVKDCIVDKFAGDPEVGVFSPSVQNTLYLAEKMVLDRVAQIGKIEMQMPNKHYFEVDMSKFPQHISEFPGNNEVYLPVDKPSGIIYAELIRKDAKSKL